MQRLISSAEAMSGRLDILVNNAGMFQHVPFNEITDEQWNGIIATNLTSQFLCSQIATPLLKGSGRGRIINLASLGGLLAWPGYTHYCVSKAGSNQSDALPGSRARAGHHRECRSAWHNHI